MSQKRKMKRSPVEKKIDETLEKWKKMYKLPDFHAQYLLDELGPDLVEAFKLPGKIQKRKLNNIEKDIGNTEYFLERPLGSGAYGSVFVGTYRKNNKDEKSEETPSVKDGDKVAIKIIDLEERESDMILINQEIMALVQGQACAQLTTYFASRVVGTKLWIIMEFVSGGSVKDLIKDCKKKGLPGLSEKNIAVIVKAVLKGLVYLAVDNKFHRDIKAANILVTDEGAVKLADFGATRQLTETTNQSMTFIGTPHWMAPETLMESGYNAKADIWSLGITCIEMATGEPPWVKVPPLMLINKITTAPPPKLKNTENISYSDEFQEFLKSCLQKEPADRLSLQELLNTSFVANAGDAVNFDESSSSSSGSSSSGSSSSGSDSSDDD